MGVHGADHATSPGDLPAPLRSADQAPDALLGYSGGGEPREPIASFIRAANSAPAPRVALDLPSGLDGDAGAQSASTIRADTTLTLTWPKTGLLALDARSVVGDLYVADISVPEAVYGAVEGRREGLFAHGPVIRARAVVDGWESGPSPLQLP